MSFSNFLIGGSIYKKAIRGGISLTIGAVFQRILRLGRTIILTHILVPDDFGLVAIIMMVVVMLESLTDAGVRLSIIQNREGVKPSYLNIAWWFQSVRGFILFALSIVLAPVIATYYKNPALTDLLRVSFLSILFNGLISPRVHLLEREFKFWKWTLLDQISALMGTICTVILAYYFHSVWAIVIGIVLERFLYCAISFILYPIKPNLDINKQNFSELLKFSKGIFGLSAMNLVARQADVFVLGKVVAPALLGSYYLSLQLADQINSLFSSVIFPVLLPSFSSLKENISNLKSTLMLVNRGVALLGIPIVVFMAINSFQILSLLYGNNYTNAGWAFSILSLNMFIRVQTSLLSQVEIGIGFPHLLRNHSMKRTFLIVGLMYPVTHLLGLVGAALVMIVANTLMLILQLKSIRKNLYIKPIEYVSGWITGVGLGILVIMPNMFVLILKIDSIIVQSVLSLGTMVLIFFIGFNKAFVYNKAV